MGSSNFSRTPGYVLTGGLVMIFLFPMIWSAVAWSMGSLGPPRHPASGSGTTPP